MYKPLYFVLSMLFAAAMAFAAQEVTGAVEGTIKKIDSDSKTIVVKTAEGSEQTFHYSDKTAVHGVSDAAKGTEASLRGLKTGSDVAVHYTSKGTTKTAEEVDHLGKDGMKAGEGTLKKIDRGAKILTVETAGGAVETYRLSDHAVRDTGLDLGKGGQKSEKVTVYYTEEAGHKVARFFRRVL